MTKYFDNSGSVLESRNEPVNIARISTFGVTSLDKRAEIRFLYPIEEEKNAHFYFGIPDEMLATDNELMRKIKTQMKNFSKDDVDTGFSVHSTDLERTIVLCSFHTSKIQN